MPTLTTTTPPKLQTTSKRHPKHHKENPLSNNNINPSPYPSTRKKKNKILQYNNNTNIKTLQNDHNQNYSPRDKHMCIYINTPCQWLSIMFWHWKSFFAQLFGFFCWGYCYFKPYSAVFFCPYRTPCMIQEAWIYKLFKKINSCTSYDTIRYTPIILTK